MESIKKIMVAFDLSEHSEKSLKYACGLAQKLKADLVVVNVLHQRDLDAVRMVEQATDRLTVDDYVEGQKIERADEIDRAVGESCREHLSIQKVFKIGIPFRELLRFVKEEKVDLLVMASKGRGNIAGLLLGSTAEKMFRHCPVPLLIIRQEDFKNHYR